MTPDQFISTMHRQRADQAALRLALTDLSYCLPAETKAQWLQALQSRIAKAQATAHQHPAVQRDALLAVATALEFVKKSLELPQEPNDAK